uniref:BZIP domain-containing protein n=1 Tax=Caenorhabditis tropicalis TaxID=1561998 RepID=A0A1I7U301_9PELO
MEEWKKEMRGIRRKRREETKEKIELKNKAEELRIKLNSAEKKNKKLIDEKKKVEEELLNAQILAANERLAADQKLMEEMNENLTLLRQAVERNNETIDLGRQVIQLRNDAIQRNEMLIQQNNLLVRALALLGIH